MRDDEWHQACLDREQQTAEAFENARKGVATDEEWTWLKYELGLRLGENHVGQGKSREVQACSGGIPPGNLLRDHRLRDARERL